MKSLLYFTISAILISGVVTVKAETAATAGAKLGEWTQDYEAAVKLAKEKDLPILLNFSGSDWCGWCKLMTKNVFSKKEWTDYASKNMVTVLLDFPKDKSLVPEAFAERNESLRATFGVKGFPTFIIVDSDGTTPLGQLGASREATPESFISDISRQLMYTDSEVAKYTSSLSKEDKEKYMAIVEKLSSYKDGIAEAKQQIEEAKEKISKLENKSEAVKAEALEFRAKQKGPEQLKKYTKLKANYDSAVKELEDWFDSDPERNKENMQKLQEMKSEIDELATKLSSF